MHVLPQLRELESRYTEDLVVIGVHSGKYHAERITPRIRDASIRLEATHPVVNDRQFRVWRSYAVSAWPTLVAIDPAGYVVGSHAGEFTTEALSPFVDAQLAIARERGTLRSGTIHFATDPPTNNPTGLKYPGKVAVDGNRIAIADSGNNRVITGTLSDDGRRMRTLIAVGGDPGFADGNRPRFHSPQGMAFAGDILYVADAENHSVRALSLDSGEVVTTAGTGSQMRTRADQQAGAMSSPWDLAIDGDTLYVAMAGTHQLWSLNIVTGQSRVHSGNGGEDIRDGGQKEALLAQPMGIAKSGGRLYFTDSESSAVRWSDIQDDGNVGTVVGTGLFDFGDVDGIADDVRLQHPQAIAVLNGDLLIADSYNDSIKLINAASRSATTWLEGFHEPGGIATTSTHAYIADTNAHRIVVVDLATKSVGELVVE